MTTPTVAESQCTLYIHIGNSDDKLTQAEWARFIVDLKFNMGRLNVDWVAPMMFTSPDESRQSAVAVVQTPYRVHIIGYVLDALQSLVRLYRQDEIIVNVVPPEGKGGATHRVSG